METTIAPGGRLLGTVRLPADKSIAHRSALLSGLADGVSEISGYSDAEDPASTLACLRQLGVDWTRDGDRVRIEAEGLEGLSESADPIDCGNSGTTMRLLAGILAGQPFSSRMIGDASLSARPMGRIAGPLRRMNARVTLTDGHAPIDLAPSDGLRGITYRLPIPSAQVKSCVLLAGLFAEGPTTVVETTPSRDHTERMLDLTVEEEGGQRRITVPPGTRIPARTWTVPRDFSAGAFFLVAAAVVPESRIRMEGVGLNPTRSGLLSVLEAMGARIEIANRRTVSGEPVGDLTVESAPLEGTSVDPDLVPVLIDEIPVLAVAGACAAGPLEVREAEELRVKETDRIAAVVANLRALGVEVEEFEDGFAVKGRGSLRAGRLESFGDHRMAMAMGVAALAADGPCTIVGAEHAAVSFPAFWDELTRIRVRD